MKEKGKCFDVALMNPPYGCNYIHLKFVDKMLVVADMQIVVMPFGFVVKDTESSKKFKEKFSNYLTNIEEHPSSVFQGTCFPSVAIYEIDMNKKQSADINIQYIDGHNINVDSLLNISFFSDYEKKIIKYLEDNGQQPITWAGGHGQNKKNILVKYPNISDDKITEIINNYNNQSFFV